MGDTNVERSDRAMEDIAAVVLTPDPFEAIRISSGYKVGNLVFTSGQASVDENGETVGAGDFDAQVEQVFSNLAQVLDAAGSAMDKVVKVTIYLTDLEFYPNVLAFRERYFRKPYPADTLVGVTSLARPEFLLEIEAIAVT